MFIFVFRVYIFDFYIDHFSPREALGETHAFPCEFPSLPVRQNINFHSPTRAEVELKDVLTQTQREIIILLFNHKVIKK